jgi:DNA-binding IclR family transcriptional regulator
VQSVGERAAGIASVSAPVYDGGQVVAAVCLSGPIERLGTSPGATYAEQVMAAAKEIQHAAATSHY